MEKQCEVGVDSCFHRDSKVRQQELRLKVNVFSVMLTLDRQEESHFMVLINKTKPELVVNFK